MSKTPERPNHGWSVANSPWITYTYVEEVVPETRVERIARVCSIGGLDGRIVAFFATLAIGVGIVLPALAYVADRVVAAIGSVAPLLVLGAVLALALTSALRVIGARVGR